MTKQTRTIETHLGSIEAETTVCHHCENEVLVDDCVQVGVGVEKTCNSSGRVRYSMDDVRDLCPYCADSLFGYGGESKQYIERLSGARILGKAIVELGPTIIMLLIVAAVMWTVLSSMPTGAELEGESMEVFALFFDLLPVVVGVGIMAAIAAVATVVGPR